MTILNFIMLFGGLSFFLYGMKVLSSGLEKLAGGRLEKALSKLTNSLTKSLLLGAGITIAIQSSSALTVMLVGLVNSGIMKLSQTVGVIMGSNIGTTLTAWITSLSGLESDSVWMSLLKPENFSLVFSLIGIILIMMSKNQRRKDIGAILVGFAVLMYGMKLMSTAMEPLRDMPEFSAILTAFNNPIVGVIVGTLFTAVIQSSAASVAILQSLAVTGTLTYSMAIPIILGQNIGTCVTALISSIGVNKNAKKVSVIHITFNILGSAIFLTLYLLIDKTVGLSFSDNPVDTAGIAVIHSVFNISTTALLLPFSRYLLKFANIIVPDVSKKRDKNALLDERLLNVPAFALSQCTLVTTNMANLAKKNLRRALDLMNRYDEKTAQELKNTENKIDSYEDKLCTYLVKLSNSNLTEQENWQATKLLHTIGDFERIGDHAENLSNIAKQMNDKEIELPSNTANSLTVVTKALYKIVRMTIDCFENNDIRLAEKVEPLEQVIDVLLSQIRAQNTQKIQKGDSPVALGFVLSDLLTNYERISDHCSNIAVAVIEIENKSFGTHKYLNKIRSFDNREFSDSYNDFLRQYSII